MTKKKLTEITCPRCDGAGEISRPVYDDDGKVVGEKSITCQLCKGQMTINVEVEADA